MRKLVLTLFIIMGTLSARAQSLLETLNASLAAMGDYQVEVSVAMGDTTTEGSYAVSDQNFYMRLFSTDYYHIDGVMYEVNTERKEIVVDYYRWIDGNEIVSNPANIFNVLARDYNQTEVTVDGRKTVKLVARNGNGDSIIVIADHSGKLPSQIIYLNEQLPMVVTLKSIKRVDSTISTFDKEKYPGFELIDMR